MQRRAHFVQRIALARPVAIHGFLSGTETAGSPDLRPWRLQGKIVNVEFPMKSGHGVKLYSVCSYSAGDTYPSDECRRLVL
jgi:hypothetical protein